MTALFPIEPIMLATERNELAIEQLLDRNDTSSVERVLGIANQTINTLITNISKNIFLSEEKYLMAEHLAALGCIAIHRIDDILDTLTHTNRDIDLEILIARLRGIKLSFASSGCDEIGWLDHLDGHFPVDEHLLQ